MTAAPGNPRGESGPIPADGDPPARLALTPTVVCLLLLTLTAPPSPACTAVLLESDTRVLIGNNEDYWQPETRLRFVPGAGADLGRVYWGFDDLQPQGGMNERGLFYDGFYVEGARDRFDEVAPECPDDIFDRIMAECSTVAEVERIVREFNLHQAVQGMLMYGDAAGRSMIIGGGSIVPKQGSFQVCTNFYQADVRPEAVTCPRFLAANELLTRAPVFSVALVRAVLDATHVDQTQYSMICDLTSRTVYLYHFHNFDEVVVFNLAAELAKGERLERIPDLFSDNDAFHERYFSTVTPINNSAMLVFFLSGGVVFLLTPFLLWFVHRRRRMRGRRASENRSAGALHLVMACAAFLTGLYIAAFSKYSAVFVLGLPPTLSGLSPPQIFLVHIPIFVGVLSVVALALYSKAATERQLSHLDAAVSAGLALLLAVNLGLFWYWGLIPFAP